MQFRLAFLAVTSTALLMSCFSPESVTCGDKATVCPSGWVCIEEQSACINPLETSCGNGQHEPELGEECDDGNFANDDECNWNCKVPGCGDGFKRGEEVCDDGDTDNGDGCSADCKSTEICGDGITNDYIHGDNLPAEQCDDRGESATCNADCTTAKCGDAKTNTTAQEECDDGILGTAVDSDDCTKTCKNSSCGDGYPNIAAGEACDKGKFCIDGKVCTSLADCVGIGDGSCEPRDRDCCTATCKAPSCGNGAVEVECEGTVNEACDIGKFCANLTVRCNFDAECNGIGDGLCKTRNETGCSADCLSPEVCGDGYTNAYLGELCDNGKQCSDLTTNCKDDSDCTEIGDGKCATRDNDGCSTDCKSTEQCGDGVTNDYGEYQEVCDNGSQCTNGDDCKTADDCVGIGNGSCAPRNQDGCSADCKSEERCGDGVASNYPIPLRNLKPMAGHPNVGDQFNAPEACDDSNTLDGDGCSADCLSEEECGDDYDNDYPHLDEVTGATLPAELCDDGNNNNGDGCSANCRSLEQCGNGGEPDEGEECDDGNKESGDGCSSTCELETCGDGEKDTGEGCDEGLLNSDTGNCKLNCQPNVCGDGATNESVDEFGNVREECDNGAINSASCNFDCTIARCGDGLLNFAADEFCDEGPGAVLGESKETLRCNVDCSFAFCGDSLTNDVRGELCDDGNNEDGDNCSADCRSTELCGDGVTNRGTTPPEVCDNGRACEDGTECGSDEDCAVGQCLTRDSDGCSEDCRSLEVCGDAYLNNYPPSLETCDDGNNVTGDGCNGTTCKTDAGWSCPTVGQPCVEVCRDGLVVGDETCDEGTATASGGCTTCNTQRGWSCPKNTTTGAGGLCTPICGDGIVRGAETCDDGNLVATDGCDATCKKTDGWSCPIAGGNGGVCTAICNDSKVVGPETCDDGATLSGDGCDSGCRLEVPGWQCPISGGVGGPCSAICGDGLVRGTETCDEGVAQASGGCTSCAKAQGWDCDQPGSSCKEICGDGIRVGIENNPDQCDNGAQNGNNKVCTANCKVATCTDDLFLTDGAAAETDVDCGGANACDRCANDSRCAADRDCVSNFCSTGLRCQTPTLSPDVWTFSVETLDGSRQKTVPVANLLSNDATAAGGLANDAVFTVVAQPTCGTIAVDGANVVFTDSLAGCAWGQTFTYKVCTPSNANECSLPTTVTVNVNHDPSLSFPDICLPLATTSATVNVASTAIFIDPDANPWGSFPTPPTFVSGPNGHTAALAVNGSSIEITPVGGPQPGSYTVNVTACDNVSGVNVSDVDPTIHKGCSPATDWIVKWQASVNLRESLEANPFPVAISAALNFPLGGATSTTIVEGTAPGSAVVTVSRFANGPFTTSTPTSVAGSTCAFVDDTNLGDGDDRRITYTSSTTAGTDNCYVQVCEPCGALLLCSVVRIPVTVASDPVAVADSVNALQGKSPTPSAGTFPVATLTGNDTSINPASFVLTNWNPQTVAATSTTECGGTVTVTGSDVIYTGPANPNGGCVTTDRFHYRVTSPAVATLHAIGTVTITINRHPTATDDVRTTPEDSTLVMNDLLGNDSDPETLAAGLRISSLSTPTTGTVQLSQDGKSVTYIPAPGDFNGSATFEYTLSDGNGGNDVGLVTVTISPVADIVADALTINEDAVTAFNPVVGTNGASADSFENGAPQITAINGTAVTAGGSAVTVTRGSVALGANNVLTFTPTPDYNGAVPAFTYTVTSGGVTETANITITILPVVDAVADTATTNEDAAIETQVLANDSFNAAATVTAVTQGAHGVVTITSAAKRTTYTPAADFNGSDSYTYTVTSGTVTETATVTVTIDPVVDIVADAVTATEDVPKVFNPITAVGGGNADSFEGTPLITAINGTPITNGASVTVTNGSVGLSATNNLTFTPRADFNGGVTPFSYTVTSGTVTETANITITVTAAADIADDTLTTNEDTAGAVSVFANDTFEDTSRSVTAVTQGTNGTVVITNATGGVVTYTPTAQFSGTDLFTYTVTSAGGLTETANVNVTINAINDPPSVSATAASTTFLEGAGQTAALYTAAAVSAFEANQNFGRLDITVTGVGAATAASEGLRLDGTTVPLNTNGGTTATNSMTYAVTLSGTTATISLTKAGGITDVQMVALINAIDYRNSSNDPAAGARVITITRIDDIGSNTSPNDNTTDVSIPVTVTVTPVNNPPTLIATGRTVTFTEDGTAADLFQTVTSSPVEAAQGLMQVVLTFAQTPPDGAAERLLIDGTQVPLVVGNTTTVINSMQVVVSFQGGLFTVAVQNGAGISASAMNTLIDTIAYSNTSQDPTAGARTVTITQLTDNGVASGPNGDTAVATFAVAANLTVAAVNDPPTLTATALNPSYNEATAPVALFSGTAINTVEAVQTITGLSLTVSPISNGVDEKLTVDGATFSINANVATTATGGPLGVSYAVSFTSNTATVTITKGGGLSVTDAQNLVNAIAYSNTNVSSTPGPRTATLKGVTDSGGATTVLTIPSVVTVVAVNNVPVITNLGGSVSFANTALLIDAGSDANVADADSPNFGGGSITVTIKSGLNTDGRTDSLELIAGTGYTLQSTFNIRISSKTVGVWSYDSGVLEILISSSFTTFTPAIASSVLQSIRFNSNGAIVTPRVLGIVINDGDGGTSAESTVTVTDANDAPTDIGLTSTSFPENAGANAVVGALSTTDADVGQAFTYTLQAGTGGDHNALFDIVNGNLVAKASFDFEGAAPAPGPYKVRIQTADNGSPPLTFVKQFNINVTNVNEAPTGGPNSKIISEDASPAFVAGDFTFSDPDAGNTLNRVQIKSPPTAGTLTLSGVAVAVDQVVMVSNFANFLFTPAPNANGTPYATFGFVVGDSGGLFDATTRTFTINVTPVNDAPTLADGALTAVNEDTASPAGEALGATIFSGKFSDTADSGTFAGIAVVANTASAGTQGVWQYSSNGGTNWAPIGTVTAAAALKISATSFIRFVPFANFNGAPPSLSLRALDNTVAGTFSTTAGAESRQVIDTTTNGTPTAIAGGTATTLSTTITPVNDAPTLTDGTLTAVNEDTANPAGEALAATIFNGKFSDTADAGTFAGIAVVANTAIAGTHGVWQYSSNGGTNWAPIGAVTASTALKISATSFIRFVPFTNFNGAPPSLSLRALDNTVTGTFSTTAGAESRQLIDTTTNGTPTAIAGGTATTLSTTITAVNDAPVAVNDTIFVEDDAPIVLYAALLANDSDPDGTAFEYGEATDGSCAVIDEGPDSLLLDCSEAVGAWTFTYTTIESVGDLLISNSATVTLVLVHTLTVVKSAPNGFVTGTVNAGPQVFGCAPDCTELVAPGATVVLTAQPDSGFDVGTWSMAGCTAGASTCTFAMPATETTVTVQFIAE